MTVADLVRNSVIAAFVAALAGGAALVLGLDGPHSLALGCGVLAVVLVLLVQRSADPAGPPVDADGDPDAEDGAQRPAVGRSDVDRLAWSMVEHRTRVRGVVVARVRAVAAHRLADRGLDLRRAGDLPAVEALLGAAAWAVLRPDRERPVGLRELDAALGSLERLPPPGPSGSGTAPIDRTSRAG